MNLPNKLTLVRIILVPFFMLFAALGAKNQSPVLYTVAAVLFALACITDYLDGHLARKHHLVTDFGKFADPLADKMLTTAAFLYMLADGVCSPVVLAIVLFREFAVAGVRMIAASSGKVIAANMWGKVKTTVQMLTILFYFFARALCGLQAGWIDTVSVLLCWAVAALTLLSGVIYLWQNRSCFSQTK